MSLEISDFSFAAVFFVLMVYLSVIVPIYGYIQKNRLKKKSHNKVPKKISEYHKIIVWSWIPAIPILLLVLFSNLTLSDIGFRCININTSQFSKKWIVYLSVVLFICYLLYNIYSIIILKVSQKTRFEASKNLPNDIKIFLPITKQEKRVWSYVAISAGVTEEVIYRGYLFYALGHIFPNISSLKILLISTLLFGFGHAYQGREAIKPTILGLFFGGSYLLFDSIVPIIVAHIIQDLVVRDLIDEESLLQKNVS